MTKGPERQGRLSRAKARADAVSQRSHEWVERQAPASRPGVLIGAWQRYQAVEGPLQSLLLTAYTVIAVLPALLVMEEYLDGNPRALADHLVRHFGFTDTTAVLLRSVLVKTKQHELWTALLAIAGALFFGLNFGRVLQLVHSRAWRISLPKHASDYWRYGLVLLGLFGLILLLLYQNEALAGDPSWAALTLTPGWIALLVGYFVWAPRLVLHKLVSARNLLPGAALTSAALVALMIFSSYVLERWVDFYATDYGGFGVVMSIFFWIGFGSTIIVVAASLSPALAVRRQARAEGEV